MKSAASHNPPVTTISGGPAIDGESALREDRVVEAVEIYCAEMEAGRQPARDEFLQRFSDVAEELAICLDGLEFVHHVAPQLSVCDGETGPPTAGTVQPLRALGDFRIVREIGRGGMGVVYEAQQLTLNRRVALKVLPFASMLDPRHLQRFKNEAMAAAQLEHPHIVPVYGVGCDRGVHHYAMKFIEGETLAQTIRQLQTDHDQDGANATSTPATVDSQRTGERETVRLGGLSTLQTAGDRRTYFQSAAKLGHDLARALDYAHEHGVVHRDIKPGNIMLDEHGKGWVADFGLARIENDASLTATGDLLGTLRYMSPEQILAKRAILDHRSDIYSLGITLYELLALQPAFSQTDRQELINQVAFDGPQPPRQIRPDVPPDLETIILTATAANPQERYQTAAELADDLQRFLNREPIRAQPATLRQQVVKWASRHARLVWSAVAFLLLATITLVGSIVWVFSALQRENRAVAEADAVISFLTDDLLAQADPHNEPDRDIRLRTVLDRAAMQIDQRLPQSPVARASVIMTLGKTYRSLGEYEEADRHLQEALDTYWEHLGENHPDTLNALQELSRLRFAEGHLEEAEQLLRGVLQTRLEILGEDHLDTLDCLHDLGRVSFEFGQIGDAGRLFSRVLKTRQSALGELHPATLDVRMDVARYFTAVGSTRRAGTHLNETITGLLSTYGPAHPKTLDARFRLASMELQQDRPHDAVATLESLLPVSQSSLGENHPFSLTIQSSLALGYLNTGRREQADTLCRKTYEIAKSTLGPGHQITADCRHVLAQILFDQGRPDEAETHYLNVLESGLQTGGRDQPAVLTALRGLARVYETLGLDVETAQMHNLIELQERRNDDNTMYFTSPLNRMYHEDVAEEQKWHEQTLMDRLLFVDRFVPAGRGGLSEPRGMTFGSDACLYVASSASDSVLRYDGTSGEFIDEFIASGSGGLEEPWDVAFHDDHFYVTSLATNSVLRYHASTGEFDRIFIDQSTAGLCRPRGLLFGSANHLFVACGGDSDVVLRFDATTGQLLDEFVPKRGADYALDEPCDLAFAPHGTLLVSDIGPAGNAVIAFDEEGQYLAHHVRPGNEELNLPAGLAYHPGGRLFISGSGSHSLHATKLDQANDREAGLTRPLARLMFAGFRNMIEQGASAEDRLRAVQDGLDSGSLPTVADPANAIVDTPWAILFDSHSNLYVSNGGTSEILRFGPGLPAVVSGRLATHRLRSPQSIEETR